MGMRSRTSDALTPPQMRIGNKVMDIRSDAALNQASLSHLLPHALNTPWRQSDLDGRQRLFWCIWKFNADPSSLRRIELRLASTETARGPTHTLAKEDTFVRKTGDFVKKKPHTTPRYPYKEGTKRMFQKRQFSSVGTLVGTLSLVQELLRPHSRSAQIL